MRSKIKLLFLLSFIFIVLKFSGLFQSLELTLYDHFWQKAPIEEIDPRIVIVGFDETDLTEHFGQWPPSNEQLAEIIHKIEAQNPAVIGFDLIRDLQVDGQLKKIFKNSDTLIGVGEHDGFDFPPILKQRRRVATALVANEPDHSGYARRIYIQALNDGSEEAKIAHMGLEIVADYLKKKNNFNPEQKPNQGDFIINGKVLNSFWRTDGGYSLDVAGGYQMLVRWRKGNYQTDKWEDRFRVVTARDLIRGQVDPQLFTDKIVLIGYRAKSVKDRFGTPVGLRYGVDIIAHVTSGLLSYIEDDRPLMRVIPEGLEYALILLAIGIAYLQSRFLTYRPILREFFLQGGVTTAIALALYLLGFELFIRGIWIPVGQLIITYLSAATILLFGSYLRHFHWLSQNLEQQVAQRTQELEENHRELKEAQNKLILEAKQLTVGRFALRMAHNGNTYLMTMNLAYGMLKKKYENFETWAKNPNSKQDLGEILEIFDESILNLREIFTNLRGITLAHSVNSEALNLNEILLEVAHSYQAICTNKQIQLTILLEPLPTLQYYRLAFKEMISILLTNAIEAVEITERQGQIALLASFSAQILKIAVKDNGCGISPELKAQITDPFVTTKSEGMGLGLYFVCQNLLKLQGTIEIESQENIGTTIALLIPLNYF